MNWLTEFTLEPAGEAQVEFLDLPPEHEGDIHERRALPPTPEGKPEVYYLHGIPELN